MRILGMDYGDSRIGLAVSDLLDITAQPLKTVFVNNGWKNAVPEIKAVAEEYQIGKVVIGYPLDKDGTPGDRCGVTDRFIEVLQKGIGDIEIIRWDERFTSQLAQRAPGTGNKADGKRDTVSAALILQSYLDFCAKKN